MNRFLPAHAALTSSVVCFVFFFFLNQKALLMVPKVCVFKATEKLPSYPLLLFYCEGQRRDASGSVFIGNELKWDKVLKGHSKS